VNAASNTISISVRFYAELNDLLPHWQKQRTFSLKMPDHNTVKHLVESLGVPHTEIDLILVNGDSVSFSFIPKDGDYISVYPVFESLDIHPILHLHPKPLRDPKFILDAHLGKLATYLRMLGFDALYRSDYQDHEIAALSSQQHRIVLTRDRGLLKRCEVTRGYCVRSTNPRQQLVEIIRRFDLSRLVKPFQRCLECNHLLQQIEKQEVQQKIPPHAFEQHENFQVCPNCNRIYWKGTHYERMLAFIKEVIE
jgi:uncharacterized protein with PIN domain